MGNPKILEKKQAIITEIAQRIEESQGVYFSDFKGMTVEQINELRRTFDKESVGYKVYKNTYIAFALKEKPYSEKVNKVLKGNTSVAFSKDDPVAPARIIKEIFTKYKLPIAKAAIVEGKFFDKTGVDKIASLPSKEELLSQLVAGIQSPISGLVYSLGGIINEFVYTVQAVKEQKEKQ